MNADEKGMDTDGWICFAKQLNHPCPSVDIRVHHLQALRPLEHASNLRELRSHLEHPEFFQRRLVQSKSKTWCGGKRNASIHQLKLVLD